MTRLSTSPITTSSALSAALAPAVLAVLVGCGPASSPNTPSAEPGHRHHDPGEEHGRHKHQHEGGMKDFHDVLAPIWHQEKGLARTDGACDKASSLASLARALETEPAPGAAAADPAGWKADAHELVLAADAIAPACAAEGRPDVEARLSATHEAFHVLMRRIEK